MPRRAFAFAATLLLLAPPAARAADPAPAPPSLAPYWTVHADRVRPDAVAAFSRLNAAENRGLHAIQRAHGVPVTPAYDFVTEDGLYLTLRPRQSLADVVKPSSVPDSVAKLYRTVTDSLDGPIHAALVHHYNQVWRFSRADSYWPDSAALAALPLTPGYVHVTSERVIPGKSDLYDALVDSLRAARARTHYPWPVLFFSATYGDGAYHWLTLAGSKSAYAASGDREAVLVRAYGANVAKRMLADWKRCLADAEARDARPDRAYTDLDPAEPWLGLPPR